MLRRNMDHLLSEIMIIGEAFNKWDLEIKAGFEHPSVLVEAMEEHCKLLMDYDEGAEDVGVCSLLDEEVALRNRSERTRGSQGSEHYILIF